MQLRDYQIRTLDQVWSALQVQLAVLATAPCSAGKTIMFSKLIQRLLRENPGFRCLILVDREILVTQSADKLRKVAPELALSIGIVCASVSAEKDVGKPVTVASRQTLINQLDRFQPVQLVICDEAHLMAMPHEDNQTPDQYSQILAKLREYNDKMRLVGFTASPYRLGSKGGYIYGERNRSDCMPYFGQVDAEITTRELLAGNYIAPLVGLAATGGGFLEDLARVGTVGGEYNLGQLSDLMCKTTHINSCVEAWQLHASDRKKTLVFCTSIEHAEYVAAAFNDSGIKSLAIHSKLSPIEVEARMQALETGDGQVFTSVAKLTTGMDVVDIDCIIMARPTKSAALYQQCIGRGQRLAEGKTDCLVIDLVGATQEFGTDMDNLKVHIPRGDGSGEAPVKICQGVDGAGIVCGAGVHASLKYCPSCGYEFPITEEVEAKLGTLKAVEFNKLPDPIRYKVEEIRYFTHESKSSGKELIRVVYDCGLYAKFSEYICLPDYYSGYAVEKARNWWEERTEEPFPETCDEFHFLAKQLMEPVEIEVVKDGKYDRITACSFADELYDEADPADYGEPMHVFDCDGEVPF